MPKDIAFILYNTPEYSEKVQVVVREETLWMTQKAMSELFGVQVPAISKHLKNIFESGELQEEVVVSKMEIPTDNSYVSINGKCAPEGLLWHISYCIISGICQKR